MLLTGKYSYFPSIDRHKSHNILFQWDCFSVYVVAINCVKWGAFWMSLVIQLNVYYDLMCTGIFFLHTNIQCVQIKAPVFKTRL